MREQKHDGVLCFGLKDEEYKSVFRACGSTFECQATDCLTDVCAFTGLVAEVVRLDGISTEVFDEHLELLETLGFQDVLFVLGERKFEPKPGAEVFFLDNIDQVTNKLHAEALKTLRRTTSGDEISKAMLHAVLILRELKTRKRVTTKQLAEKLEVSPRTIQRYMRTLQAAEIMLDYDRSDKCWYLFEGMSNLFGGFDTD